MDGRILTPIPTPPSQRWREVRLLYLPRAVFVIGILVAAWLWRSAVAPGAIVAEAEALGADLRTSQAGVLATMNVSLHQKVKSGEVIGQLAPANPRLLDATLAVIRAEMGMLSATLQGATDRQRVALELERMQIDWMSHRVERAGLQGKLQQTEADLARAEPLYRAKLISEENYAQLTINRDALRAQLEEENKLIARLEPMLRIALANDPQLAFSSDSALAAAIKVQESKLQLAEVQLAPAPLIAPIDGVVTQVLRRAGETLVAGDAILRITSTKPERLSGYVRQPMAFDPKLGMTAEIRTRSTPPRVAGTTITSVGAPLEPISPTVLTAMRLPTTPTPETALRIEFSMPPGLNLRPGEHVDVILR